MDWITPEKNDLAVLKSYLNRVKTKRSSKSHVGIDFSGTKTADKNKTWNAFVDAEMNNYPESIANNFDMTDLRFKTDKGLDLDEERKTPPIFKITTLKEPPKKRIRPGS